MTLYKHGQRIERYPFEYSKIVKIRGRISLKEIKVLLGLSKYDNVPVEYIDGDSLPTVIGKGWHYTTITGIPISFPSAYAKKGWSSMIYCHSTRKLVVGRDFIK